MISGVVPERRLSPMFMVAGNAHQKIGALFPQARITALLHHITGHDLASDQRSGW
jgi:hypothetical protein